MPPSTSEQTPLLGPGSLSQPHLQTSGLDEETGLNASSSDGQEAEAEEVHPDFSVVAVLLLGVLIANVDSTLLMAQTGAISSDFHDLSKADWLLTSFFLASCSAQPILGKLSDIYGRKPMLLISYAFFTVGNFITGAGQTLSIVLLGRAIAGVGGGAMSSLVSIVISDLVPVRSIATWRSYVNVAATTGRSCGGPIGGLLSDTVGWRWSMYGQCPLTILAFILVAYKLQPNTNTPSPPPSAPSKLSTKSQSQISKLRRIDFSGAALLITSTLTFLLGLKLASNNNQWLSPVPLSLWAASLISTSLFILIESRFAKEPVFPVHLMWHRDVITSYLVGTFQMFAQVQLMFAVPLYFQLTMGASATSAGTRLVPAVVGNAVGGLMSGALIKRTGRYKVLTWCGIAFGCLGYALTIVRWHGHTNWLESLYIFPGGFGMGVVQSTLFVALTAGVSKQDYAVAGSGFYVVTGIGGAMAGSVVMVVLQATLRPALEGALSGLEGRDEIIRRAMQDVNYVQGLKGFVRRAVVESYIEALSWTHVSSLCFSSAAFLIALFIKERPI